MQHVHNEIYAKFSSRSGDAVDGRTKHPLQVVLAALTSLHLLLSKILEEPIYKQQCNITLRQIAKPPTFPCSTL